MIITDNGCGIPGGEEGLKSFATIGFHNERPPVYTDMSIFKSQDIGMHGLGGKAAAYAIGQSIQIETRAKINGVLDDRVTEGCVLFYSGYIERGVGVQGALCFFSRVLRYPTSYLLNMIPFMVLFLPPIYMHRPRPHTTHPLFLQPRSPSSPSLLSPTRSGCRYMRPTELMDDWEMPMLMTRELDGRETPGRAPDVNKPDEWFSFTRVTIWGLNPSTIELFSSKDELDKLRQEVRRSEK